MQRLDPWHGRCELRFEHRQTKHGDAGTVHQGGCSAPFKLLRAEQGKNGRCELPILHTAGGLVGGDQLSIALDLNTNSRCLITSVAAQKVYGSIGRSRLHPEGQWARQQVHCKLANSSDLEWLPQELVLYANALFEQAAADTAALKGYTDGKLAAMEAHLSDMQNSIAGHADRFARVDAAMGSLAGTLQQTQLQNNTLAGSVGRIATMLTSLYEEKVKARKSSANSSPGPYTEQVQIDD